MEAEIQRLATLSNDELFAEAGKKALELDGVLGAVPPKIEELIDIGKDWWDDAKGVLCEEVFSTDAAQKIVHGKIGIDPASNAIGIAALLNQECPNLHAVQIAVAALLFVRLSVKEICG